MVGAGLVSVFAGKIFGEPGQDLEGLWLESVGRKFGEDGNDRALLFVLVEFSTVFGISMVSEDRLSLGISKELSKLASLKGELGIGNGEGEMSLGLHSEV